MADQDGIIATHYRIDLARQAPPMLGGLRAFIVIDRRDPAQPLMAVETRPDLPARPRIPLACSGSAIPHAVLPIEYGPGRDLSGKPGWFVVSEALPGKPLQVGGQAWREQEVIGQLLQPAAAALAGLQARGLTHRAISPANLFRAGPRDGVTLGPFWAAPPGSLQPPVFEPPYMARCLPAGRGDGCIADDVYALGVTMLCLALGHVPMADLDDAAMLARKMELGSFAALTGDATLSPLICDLLRGMLAEDPDHRPSPALLQRPEQARARRVVARPPRRAQQPINVGGAAIWSARELAFGLSLRPERAHTLLKTGEVERWLRRCLGDPQLGMRVEDVTKRSAEGGEDPRAQGLLLMRSLAVLDPLTPLIWRGVAIQPDGLGTALVASTPEVTASLEEIVAAEAAGQFYAANPHRHEPAGLREDQREWRAWLGARGPAGGLKRLIYGLNPMLACASPLLAGRQVVRAADLLPALDAAAATTDRSRPPIDAHIAAFLAARVELAISGELTQLASFARPADRLAVLRLFGRLQGRLHPEPLPGLAGWLVSSGFATLDGWKSRKRRAELERQITAASEQGQILNIVELVDDAPGLQADRAGAVAASAHLLRLEQALEDSAGNAPHRADAARLLGHELVTGAGLVASLGAALALAL